MTICVSESVLLGRCEASSPSIYGTYYAHRKRPHLAVGLLLLRAMITSAIFIHPSSDDVRPTTTGHSRGVTPSCSDPTSRDPLAGVRCERITTQRLVRLSRCRCVQACQAGVRAGMLYGRRVASISAASLAASFAAPVSHLRLLPCDPRATRRDRDAFVDSEKTWRELPLATVLPR